MCTNTCRSVKNKCRVVGLVEKVIAVIFFIVLRHRFGSWCHWDSLEISSKKIGNVVQTSQYNFTNNNTAKAFNNDYESYLSQMQLNVVLGAGYVRRYRYFNQSETNNDFINIIASNITGRSKNVTSMTKVWWKRDAFTDPKTYEENTGCKPTCSITTEKTDADILISTLKPESKTKLGQLTVHFSRESLPTHGAHIGEFDMTMDMSPLSNIPITSVPNRFWGMLHSMPIPSVVEVSRRKLAVWYGSNCRNTQWDRTGYLKKLSTYIEIDFPGKCLHNTDTKAVRAAYASNEKLYNDYMFVFGFHNSLDNRNIDEKMFQAFAGNAVNVVMANDIAYYFSPGKHSFIDASRFKTHKDLAEYLKHLQQNPRKYLEYFEYRKQDKPPKVLEAIQETSIYQKGNLCRVCACIWNRDCRRKRTVTQKGYAVNGAGQDSSAGPFTTVLCLLLIVTNEVSDYV